MGASLSWPHQNGIGFLRFTLKPLKRDAFKQSHLQYVPDNRSSFGHYLVCKIIGPHKKGVFHLAFPLLCKILNVYPEIAHPVGTKFEFFPFRWHAMEHENEPFRGVPFFRQWIDANTDHLDVRFL